MRRSWRRGRTSQQSGGSARRCGGGAAPAPAGRGQVRTSRSCLRQCTTGRMSRRSEEECIRCINPHRVPSAPVPCAGAARAARCPGHTGEPACRAAGPGQSERPLELQANAGSSLSRAQPRRPPTRRRRRRQRPAAHGRPGAAGCSAAAPPVGGAEGGHVCCVAAGWRRHRGTSGQPSVRGQAGHFERDPSSCQACPPGWPRGGAAPYKCVEQSWLYV